nr:GSTe4 [Pagiophloeus tsushimanus]
MGRKLYMVWGSPPVNAVVMTAKALNVELELHEMDFEKQEVLQEWFLELNPSHTVPTLDDNGFILWDSHAILVYLAETYGKDTNLYSSDPKEKSRIQQILNLDCGTVFRRVSDAIRPVFYEDQKIISPKHLESVQEVYTSLERILKTSAFLANDRLTIADISVFSTVIIGNMFLPIDEHEFPNLKKWLVHLQTLDFYEAAKKGVEALKLGFRIKLGLDI